MAFPTKSVEMTLNIEAGDDTDAEEIDRLTRQLLSEINELDVETAEIVKSGETAKGVKSGELVTLGSLAVVLLPTAVPKLIELVQSWATRAENRIVKIKAQVEDRSIEVEYSPKTMSPEDLKKLVSTLVDALPPSGKSADHP